MWQVPADAMIKNMDTKKRLTTIDGIRGITIVSMVLYHFCWDLVYICGFPWSWYTGTGAYIWQQSICWSFILISGFCVNLAREPVKNGLLVFACGLVVSIVTMIFMPEEPVICGVLTFLGSAMLLTGILHPFLQKLPALPAMLLSLCLFLFTRPVNRGYLGLLDMPLIRLPGTLYSAFGGRGAVWIGFPGAGFVSSDYFSLIPWLFLFLTGYFLYRCLPAGGDGREPDPRFCVRIPVFDWIGRHSLLIYMLHQVILYGISMLILTASRI